MNKLTIFIGIVVFCLSCIPAYAGGGRYEIQNYNGTGLIGPEGLYIQGLVYGEYPYPSTGERVEFRVKNPRVGDYCTTTNPTTDQNGQIFGQCFVTQPGSILVYMHSFDKNEDSSEMILYFVAPPIKAPTKTAMAAPNIKQESIHSTPPTPTVFKKRAPMVNPPMKPNLFGDSLKFLRNLLTEIFYPQKY